MSPLWIFSCTVSGVAGEGLAAPALVWLLAGVDAEVASGVRALVEGLATLAARIPPLPGVHPAVHAEQRAAAEGLLTGAPLVGPLSRPARVDAVVHAERRVAAEGLTTLRAEKGLLARASALVLHEVGAPGEGLVALVALAGLVAVPAQVQCQS